ncbi:Signal transduction histidine-protein kinase BarA [Aquisphaera giovannonii]|uniref:Sensory/regulatory protein RpfC n=1 Tax=Aquisphaera giovannonii TaxID=406548 RepID=A0A5B9VV31_9BACT|nr:PAS domain S-box protein [Aquisphaera giovannonii]QEH31595.1 Signal transduction histidine-protein kinase BarA [Aquisphaera giovannonii]
MMDELRRAELDLAHLATIVESSDDAIVARDLDGVITAWNLAAERIFGYTAAEALGRPIAFLVPPDRRDEESSIMAKLRRGERVDHFESVRLAKDGRAIDVSLTISPIRDRSGRVVGISKIARDITDRKRAEEAIRASERVYRAIGESIAFGAWICDPEGRNIYASESFLRLVGLTQRECSEYGWGRVLHPDDAERTIAAWKECVRSGGTWDMEHRFLGVDGRYHPVLARGVPVRDDDGRVICWAGLNLDIGRLMEAEEALRRSEERQRRALTAARLAHWEWDIGADRITYQDSLQLLYGRPDDRPFADFPEYLTIVHPEDRGTVRRAAERAMEPGVPYEVEYRIVWPDGTVRWLAGRGATVFDGRGTPSVMAGVNLDITDRKAAEAEIRLLNEGLERKVRERTAELAAATEAIRESEERFRGAFDAAAIGMALVAADGRFLRVNGSLCEIVGYDEAELLGRTFQDITHPDDLDADLEHVRRIVADEIRSYHLEKRYIRKDGQVVWVRLSVSLVRGGAGLPLHFVAQIEDITDRKRADEALRRARDEAMQATRAKGDFLANMSHEIRTPMNGVIGMAELLLDTQLDDLQRGYAQTIRSSGEALLTVINDILDFSKIEAGKMTLEPADFDLVTLMEEVADLLAPGAHRKGLEIHCRVAPDVPGRLTGDPVRIRQVLTNLAGNAVKFTERGAVCLEASVAGRDRGGVTIRVQVRDTGIGIPAGRHSDIFESFTQIDGGSSRRHGGTGLGLAICRRLIDLMGGRIGVESRPDAGSTFWFELPLGEGRGGDGPAAGPLGLRVLIVDGQEASRAILRETLLGWECRPEVAASGAEALDRLLANPEDDPFGLILIDREMPGMDGEQTARAIKAAPRYAGVPLVLLTSLGSHRAGEELDDRIWAARLTKPVRRAQLQDALRLAAAPGPCRDGRPGAEAAEGASGRPLRVLLAEDNEVNRRVAIGMAERLGCAVEAVGNGREALEALDHGRHDLVLMDLQMPEMDGFAATAAIRERERRTGRHIPVIALTASAMQGDRDRCLSAGMDGYISKPIRPGALRDALRGWGPRGAPPSPPGPNPDPGHPELSAATLAESCGNDPEVTREVLGLMLEDVPARLEGLREAVEAGDGRRVAWEAHGLKGAFLTVGANALAAACQELTAAGERGDSAASALLYRRLRDRWGRLVEEAARHLGTLPAAPPR